MPTADNTTRLASNRPDHTATELVRVPQYRRDIFPRNIVLSSADIKDFCYLLDEANKRSKAIELGSTDFSAGLEPEEARKRIDDLMPLEYNYRAGNGDSVQGLGVPRTDGIEFPEDLQSFFASNASYAQRAIGKQPLNIVEAFLGFEKPSLRIDLQTLPSNPTHNKSVINVVGRSEDWVISTEQRIKEFLRRKQAFRPIIHGSGTYDYFVYLAFLPALILIVSRREGGPLAWLMKQSTFLNVILAIYALLVSLLLARFAFQYFRWLFPPMEYYKSSRVGAYLHRAVAASVATSILLRAAYDLIKAILDSI